MFLLYAIAQGWYNVIRINCRSGRERARRTPECVGVSVQCAGAKCESIQREGLQRGGGRIR